MNDRHILLAKARLRTASDNRDAALEVFANTIAPQPDGPDGAPIPKIHCPVYCSAP